MPRPSFSPTAVCDSQGHQWRTLKPPSGKAFERCMRCRAERGGSMNLPPVDDIVASKLVAAARAGTLSPEVAAGVLYLDKVRSDQARTIEQFQSALREDGSSASRWRRH